MNHPVQPPRRQIVTIVLIAINVLLFLLQAATGTKVLDPSPESMLAWGGNLAAYTLVDQPWRLLTSMFLHVGLLHLAINMYMLLAFGSLVEQRFGQVRFLLVYLLSGLVGSLVSALWHVDPFNQAIGAGASGALMGLCGAYLADWLVARWRHDPHEQVTTGGPLVQTIVINLVIGAAIPGIDNAAHVGGLAGGLIVGGAFALVAAIRGRLRGAVAVAIISCAALGGIYAVLQREPSAELRMMRDMRANDEAKEAGQAAPGRTGRTGHGGQQQPR